MHVTLFWLSILVTIVLLIVVGIWVFQRLQRTVQYKRKRIWFVIPGDLVLIAAAIFIFIRIFDPFATTCFSPLTKGYKCEQGTIKVGGSTALKPLLQVARDDYESQCGATITVFDEHSPAPYTMTGSIDGLDGLINGELDIGSSDIFMADHRADEVANYHDYQIAVVCYVIIVHRGAGMPGNINVSDLQAIYGTSTPLKWGQFGGPPNTVVVPFTRDETSGTQRTFEQHIFNPGQITVPESQRRNNPGAIIQAVANTPGAIGYVSLDDAITSQYATKVQILRIGGISADAADIGSGQYPFWNIEHLYIKENNPPKLAQSFANFLGSDVSKVAIRNHNYIPIDEVPQDILNARCPQNKS